MKLLLLFILLYTPSLVAQSVAGGSWGLWTEWGQCSVTCGRGRRSRSRQCSGSHCTGDFEESKRCHVSCTQWRNWSQWGPCSATCGQGTQSRGRHCAGLYGCQGVKIETKPCSAEPCGEWDSWGLWAACSAKCDGGTRTRTRVCSNHGGCLGPAKQHEECNRRPCCTQWSVWSSCTMSCLAPGQINGVQIRGRRCSTYTELSGPTGYASEEEREEQACSTVPKPCPVWMDWSGWTLCSKTCGGGVSSRTRYCNALGECEGLGQEFKKCNLQPCCTQWTAWSSCSTTCTLPGEPAGAEGRWRHCSNGGYGANKETRPCQKPPDSCARFMDWTQWSVCTKSCGGGRQARKRECTITGACEGDKEQQRQCNKQGCPAWTKWNDWGDCDRGCGGGRRTRIRTCIYDQLYCTTKLLNTAACACRGDYEEFKVCSEQSCAHWDQWGRWGACNAQCSGGLRTKQRDCIKDTSFCTDANPTDPSCACSGKGFVKEPCNGQKCAFWSQWMAWGDCTASCQGGTRPRQRTCTRDEGLCASLDRNTMSCKCEGRDRDQGPCNNHKCPAWQDWAEWGECTKPCNGGQRKRNRKCRANSSYCQQPGNQNNPECACDGDATDVGGCNEFPCAKWTPWESWVACDCSQGTRSRIRVCQTDPTNCNSSKEQDEGCQCLGKGSEVSSCKPSSCSAPVVIDEWTDWGTWSECTELCGGTRTRVRACPEPNQCHGLAGQTVACPVQVCVVWTDWTAWSPCTVTCGSGQSTRIRLCPVANSCSPGTGIEHKDCFVTCKGYGEWSAWSECSVTCGKGVLVRSRPTCKDPQAHCPPERQKLSCQKEACKYGIPSDYSEHNNPITI